MDRWLILEPADTVAIRDGRAFDAGVQSVSRAVAPQPSTVAGAVGAAFGAAPGAGADPAALGVTVPTEIRGPVTVRQAGGRWHPLWPLPRDVVCDEDTDAWVRLPVDEDQAGVCHDLGPLRLLTGDGEAEDGWWTGGQLADYLSGKPADLSPTAAPWQIERRVGLARSADRTAAEGMLYAAEHLRPAGRLWKDDRIGPAARVGLAVLCVDCPPDRDPAETVFLGGEGRRAQVHADPATPPKLPDTPTAIENGRLLLYLATPAVFADGWRPAEADLRGGELVAAAVGGPQVIATGRPDRRTGGIQHTRLRWAAEAGSVYFLKFATEQAALAAAQGWHGRAFTQPDKTLRTAGFGLALVGSW